MASFTASHYIYLKNKFKMRQGLTLNSHSFPFTGYDNLKKKWAECPQPNTKCKGTKNK